MDVYKSSDSARILPEICTVDYHAHVLCLNLSQLNICGFNMHRLHILFLAFITYALHIALGYDPIEGRVLSGSISVQARDQTLSANEVDLGLIEPFEPWPGYFQGKGSLSSRSLNHRIQKRSPEANMICRRLDVPAGSDEYWTPNKACCDTTDPIKKRFLVNCQHPNVRGGGQMYVSDLEGRCQGNTMCVEFLTASSRGISTTDISCQSRDKIRQWAIDAAEAEAKEGICSPSYVNRAKTREDLRMTLQTNVLDKENKYYVSPSEVFYKMDWKRIGHHRAHNGIVGSGVLRVPWGSGVVACVTPDKGQLLTAFVTLTAMMFVNDGKRRKGGWHGGELAFTDKVAE